MASSVKLSRLHGMQGSLVHSSGTCCQPYLTRSTHFHSRLRGSWRLWQKWREIEIPCRAPPLSHKATLAMAFFFAEWGFRNEALLLRLAFNRLMRTHEFLALTAGQFTLNVATLGNAHRFAPDQNPHSEKAAPEARMSPTHCLFATSKPFIRHLEPRRSITHCFT